MTVLLTLVDFLWFVSNKNYNGIVWIKMGLPTRCFKLVLCTYVCVYIYFKSNINNSMAFYECATRRNCRVAKMFHDKHDSNNKTSTDMIKEWFLNPPFQNDPGSSKSKIASITANLHYNNIILLRTMFELNRTKK